MGQRLTLPIVLEVGALTESITVSAIAGLLNTANAERGDVIDNRQVVELPLNGRQFLQLAQLTDGIAIPPGGTRGAALGQTGSLPAVYGQRSGHNIYLLDGVKVTDELFNNLVVSPSIDAIQEFKIQKTMYPAEFGGKASALINVVTKSGSNAFHGSGIEFFRSDAFDARNYFDDPTAPVPPLKQHQFGANLGGPMVLNRSFFFLSYEGQRIDRLADADLLGSNQRASRRRFLRPGGAVRSVDAHGRRMHAICGQQDSGPTPRSGGGGAARPRAAADK